MFSRTLRSSTFALVALAACGDDQRTPSDGGVPDAGTVPDFCAPEAPCPLASGVQFREGQTPPGEYLSPIGDVDRFSIDVAQGDIVNVEVEMVAPRSRVQLRAVLFAPDQTQVEQGQWSGSPSQAQAFAFQHVAEVGGTYLIDVRDVANDDDDDVRTYTVTVTLIAQSDDNEPNDTPDEATPLAAGTPASGQIASQGDQDWFTFDAAANQIIELRPTFPTGGELDLRWELYAAANPGEPIAESGSVGADQNRAVGADGGTYLLRVFEADGRSSQTEAYAMAVDLISEPDPNDLAAPNETREDATVLSLGARTEGFIAANGDFDYYAVDVSGASEASPRIVSVDLAWTGSPSADVLLQFSLLDAEGRLVCPDGDPACLSLRTFQDGSFTQPRCHDNQRCAHAVPVTRSGRYYVLVQDQGDDAFDSTARYELTVDIVATPADDDEDFVNGVRVLDITTATTASVIEFEWAEGYISYAGDFDTFVMQFPQPPYSVAQNGDWEWSVDFLVEGPSEIEYSAVVAAPDRQNSGNVGANPIPQCGDVPAGPSQPDPCNAADGQNRQEFRRGALSPSCDGSDEGRCCQVIFRQNSTSQSGQWFFQVRDASSFERLDGFPAGDDFDVRPQAKYRFRLRARAGCQVPGPCAGRFIEPDVGDRCGRP